TENLVKKLFKQKLNKKSESLELYLSGISLNGIKFFDETPAKMVDNIFELSDQYGYCSNYILTKIKEKSLQYNYNIITCFCPFDPQSKIDHIIIPELNIAFLTTNKSLKLTYKSTKVINCKRFLQLDDIKKYKSRLNFNQKTILSIAHELSTHIEKAKKSHDDIEEIYIEAIDFKEIDTVTENILNQILSN
ncbi:MAG: hypothetical protein ACRCZK_02875, partial [Oscillospiraceae bacterium]